jgi:hypothetical protein
VDTQAIDEALSDIYDHALEFHGFSAHLRDYDLFIQVSADPATDIATEHLRYRFTHCVQANVVTSISPEVWSVSLDPRLIDYQTGVDLDGYVWGVNWQELYPTVQRLESSHEADAWTQKLGVPFHEGLIRANAHQISLVFSDLEITSLESGHAPFVVGPGFFDGKKPFSAERAG